MCLGPERRDVVRHATLLAESCRMVDEYPILQDESCLNDKERSVMGSDSTSDGEYQTLEYLDEPPEWSLDETQEDSYSG